MGDPIIGNDPRILDLLEAFGFDPRNRPIKSVEIKIRPDEAVALTVVEYANADDVLSVVKQVKRYELQAVEKVEPKVNVYSQSNCTWHYCPHSHICSPEGCVHPRGHGEILRQ